MAQFVELPVARIGRATLAALLEEFATRDGTDYGEREVSLAEKIGQLRCQVEAGEVVILYDGDSEEWDLVERDRARDLLTE